VNRPERLQRANRPERLQGVNRPEWYKRRGQRRGASSRCANQSLPSSQLLRCKQPKTQTKTPKKTEEAMAGNKAETLAITNSRASHPVMTSRNRAGRCLARPPPAPRPPTRAGPSLAGARASRRPRASGTSLLSSQRATAAPLYETHSLVHFYRSKYILCLRIQSAKARPRKTLSRCTTAGRTARAAASWPFRQA
jgi:hypothetical protein